MVAVALDLIAVVFVVGSCGRRNNHRARTAAVIFDRSAPGMRAKQLPMT